MTSREQANRDLDKALNLALLGLVGALIPILGIILAIVAFSLAGGTEEDEATRHKYNLVRAMATLAILLSIVCAVVYLHYYIKGNS